MEKRAEFLRLVQLFKFPPDLRDLLRWIDQPEALTGSPPEQVEFRLRFYDALGEAVDRDAFERRALAILCSPLTLTPRERFFRALGQQRAIETMRAVLESAPAGLDADKFLNEFYLLTLPVNLLFQQKHSAG